MGDAKMMDRGSNSGGIYMNEINQHKRVNDILLRTYVAGEFKISYGRLGPTESRALAVLLNTAIYFFGLQNIVFGQEIFSIYDIPVAALAVLLLSFFINTATREARRLATLGE